MKRIVTNLGWPAAVTAILLMVGPLAAQAGLIEKLLVTCVGGGAFWLLDTALWRLLTKEN